MDANKVGSKPAPLTAAPADLYLGLGNVVYALAKVDGGIDPEETRLARQLLGEQPYGELALHTFFLLENCAVPVEEAYDFALRRFTTHRKFLTVPMKKRFVNILLQIAEAHNNTSARELELIQRFRHDLGRL
ncbi:tellurite resistance TerB family protein [Spirosoma sordidisoli]|uniref:TerB family tellurite resistance protein n=1 Tax=Spirosoma sordidisoli TaxID=2502893 RepID=A0A4Q2UGX3_9BACT|nr:TerB family tellurite resistance protein [Spirosoma sordidisoli]RYC68607.1 TerB family tellurite resistance protein [Spirosoma sordidisoli]